MRPASRSQPSNPSTGSPRSSLRLSGLPALALGHPVGSAVRDRRACKPTGPTGSPRSASTNFCVGTGCYVTGKATLDNLACPHVAHAAGMSLLFNHCVLCSRRTRFGLLRKQALYATSDDSHRNAKAIALVQAHDSDICDLIWNVGLTDRLHRGRQECFPVVAADTPACSAGTRAARCNACASIARLASPALTRNEGRMVKLTSDGALVEFASAADPIVLCSDLITIVSWH
jgi:hypothetical protein